MNNTKADDDKKSAKPAAPKYNLLIEKKFLFIYFKFQTEITKNCFENKYFNVQSNHSSICGNFNGTFATINI